MLFVTSSVSSWLIDGVFVSDARPPSPLPPPPLVPSNGLTQTVPGVSMAPGTPDTQPTVTPVPWGQRVSSLAAGREASLCLLSSKPGNLSMELAWQSKLKTATPQTATARGDM